jgi:hypothetical protein
MLQGNAKPAHAGEPGRPLTDHCEFHMIEAGRITCGDPERGVLKTKTLRDLRSRRFFS